MGDYKYTDINGEQHVADHTRVKRAHTPSVLDIIIYNVLEIESISYGTPLEKSDLTVLESECYILK